MSKILKASDAVIKIGGHTLMDFELGYQIEIPSSEIEGTCYDPEGVPYEEDHYFDKPTSEKLKKICAYCRDECTKSYQVRRFHKTILLNDMVMIPRGRNHIHKACWKQFEADGFIFVHPTHRELDEL